MIVFRSRRAPQDGRDRSSYVAGLAWLIATLGLPPNLAVATNLVVILVGGAYWYVRFRIGTLVERRRVTWLLQMVLVFAVLLVVAQSLSAYVSSAGGGENARAAIVVGNNLLAAIGGAGSLAMAVFRAGAVNPGLVVRTTVVYGATISVLLFALNVIVSVLVDRAADVLGLSDRVVAATLGALAGLAIEPLARRMRLLLVRKPPATT